MKTLHLIIHGHVQGVYYRDSMRREAQRLSVAGWVRNRVTARSRRCCTDLLKRWRRWFNGHTVGLSMHASSAFTSPSPTEATPVLRYFVELSLEPI